MSSPAPVPDDGSGGAPRGDGSPHSADAVRAEAAPRRPAGRRAGGSTAMGQQPSTGATGGGRAPTHQSGPSPLSGITSPAVALLLAILTGAGAAADGLVFKRLSWFFGALFCLGCAWVALRVRWRDRRAALVVPPLVYAATVAVAVLVAGGSQPLRQLAFDGMLLLSDRAPVLLAGLALVVAIMLGRRRRRQRH